MKNKNRPEEIKEKALEYLKRYNDTFIAKGYSSKSWAYDYATITFIPGKYPESLVEVRAYKDEDGSYFFKDDYFKCFMEKDAIAFFDESYKDIVSKEVKVRFPNTIWSDEINDCCSFGEWVSSGNSSVDVFYIAQSEFTAESKERLISELANKRIDGTVTFIVTSDTGNLKDYSLYDVLNNLRDIIKSKTKYEIRK